jgi:hypothetical protein
MPVTSGSIQICGAGAHALHIARGNALDIAQGVLVRQFATEHITDDLHVAVAVGAETGARRNAVFVDDAQIAPAHVGRVVVTGEGEAVEGLQPTVVSPTAISRFAQGQHHGLLFVAWVEL